MIRSIAKLFQFNVYNTREAAQSAGLPTPTYTTDKPVKSWADPAPLTDDEDGLVSYLMLATTKSGCSDTPLVKDGKPYLRTYKMTPDEAKALNIPPKGDFPDLPQPKGEWNVPCRPLGSDEEFAFAFGGIPEVRKKSAAPVVGSTGGSPTVDLGPVMEALAEINAKIDLLRFGK